MPTGEFACGLVSGRTTELSPGIVRCLAERNIQWAVVPALRREIHPLRDLCALRALRRLIREERPDIVHTHTSKAGFLGRLAAHLEHVPHIIHTPHGHVFGGYFSPAATRIFIGLERLAARWSDRIVTLTDAEAAQHLALGIGRRAQFATIPSGVDLDGIASAVPVRLAPHGPVIGTVGRLTSIKGHQHLIDAVPEILRRCPTAHVVLVGDGELQQALVERTRRLGVESRVIFTGYRDDIPALIAGMDVFVLPSLNEGMGRVLVMAMALGKPIVATRVGGVPELLADGEAGVLVPPADPIALARMVCDLIEQPDRARVLGEAGRRRAPQYSAEAMLGVLVRLYRELMAGDHRN
ncbi:MAG: glycosyltransferase family 4 protein [candidate division NC10 bacterium]|nr:glycosyltransferase family 4 protein [candidate division NC10 bacterium]